MKYIYILVFLLTHDLSKLKEYWSAEVVRKKQFNWWRLLLFFKKNKRIRYNYLFWWRLANEMFLSDGKRYRKIASKLNQQLIRKYGIEIGVGAVIGKNIHLTHLSGIVISGYVVIGENFSIKQNSTIGIKTLAESHGSFKENYKITIGNNVVLGAHSCIIGDDIIIGDDVVIGSMSFINKNIPSDCTVYTEKLNKIILNRKC